jgi:F0F1-type ATP synthase assembly protein I
MAKAPPKRAAWFRATDAASVGIEIVVAICIGTFGGLWLERSVTHWSPWTTLLGLAIGLGAATKAITRAARNYKRSLAEPPDAAQR